MKVLSAWLLGSWLMGLMFALSATAGETEDAEKGKAELVKERAAEAVEQDKSNQHDVLKTKFLGSRPYMETKSR